MVQEILISLTNEQTKAAYTLCLQLANSNDQYYLTSGNNGDGSFTIALKGSMPVQDYYNHGETNVDGDLFPALRRIGEVLLAKVNASVLQKFKDLLISSEFKSKMEKILKEGKKIIFTGHSGGGAIASLATLWVLNELRRKQKVEFQIDCVTFGSKCYFCQKKLLHLQPILWKTQLQMCSPKG